MASDTIKHNGDSEINHWGSRKEIGGGRDRHIVEEGRGPREGGGGGGGRGGEVNNGEGGRIVVICSETESLTPDQHTSMMQ